MKKLLITGASGFIGSFLVEEALKRGFEVHAGVRKTSDLRYLQDERIRFFKTGLADKETLKQGLAEVGGFDFVIHNAGVTKTCDKSAFDRVNYELTRNLVDALTESGFVPEKFILVSSLAALGPGDPRSQKPIRSNDEPKPVSLYGKSKLRAERYLESQPDFPYLIFRPTGVYGPREMDYYAMYKSIRNGLETYIGTRKQHLSFIYVRDLVRLLLDALASPQSGKNYLVSDLQSYTAVEFNAIVKTALGKKTVSLVFPAWLVRTIAAVSESLSCLFTGKAPTLNTEKFKEISQRNWLCDSSDLVKDFGFRPEYQLEKGVAEALEWYKQNKLL